MNRVGCYVYTSDGIYPNCRGSYYMNIYAIDTESYKGKPMCFQFDDGKEQKIIFVNEGDVTETFLNYLEKIKGSKSLTQNNIIFAHNLMYDMCMLFYKHISKMIEEEKNKGEFKFKINGWKIQGFLFGDSEYIHLKKGRIAFEMIDCFQFFKMSLNEASRKLLNMKKENPPKNIGKKIFTHQNKKFVKYALRDVYLTREIGKLINDIHNRYNVRQSISISQLAERIFRHKFLRKPIPACPHEIVGPALESYHGGKNGFYVPKGLYKDVYSYDIVSAYPYAMRELPDFSEGDYYEVNKYEQGYVGIYQVTGNVKFCLYPIIYDINFKPLFDDIQKVWITSYELEEAIYSDEINIKKIKGYIFVPKSKKEKTPLQEFVDHFWRLKNETDKLSPYYQFYKIILNSLYGKFIQMRKRPSNTKEYKCDEWCLGQMFHPFIATLITGKVRAMMHHLEHQHQSIHTSTDSIMTVKPIKEKYLSDDLGGLKFVHKGDCLLLRNKLYLHFDSEGNIKRYALHGFQGTPEKLWEMWLKGIWEYEFEKMNLPLESRVQNLKPFIIEKRKASLHL